MSVEAIGVLSEPLRRAVYARAVAAGVPVSRNDIADALGIGRTLAAHHLDKLADAGLLDVSFARLTGRTGPGAGRPAKLYRRASTEHELSLPPREYRVLAELLAEAVEEVGADPALYAAARRRGERLAGVQPEELLRRLGYEPYVDGDAIRLRNCPFDGVARDFPALVCGANLALLEGALGSGVRIDPRPEGCCVVFERGSGGTKNNDR